MQITKKYKYVQNADSKCMKCVIRNTKYKHERLTISKGPDAKELADLTMVESGSNCVRKSSNENSTEVDFDSDDTKMQKLVSVLETGTTNFLPKLSGVSAMFVEMKVLSGV